MIKIIGRVLRWSLILVVALIVTGVSILLTTDPNTYRTYLADGASEALGRTVAIDGPFDVEFGLTPVITASGVRVANAPGYEPDDMISIGALEISAALLPLLGSRVEINRLRLNDVSITLAERADGTTNYDDLVGNGGEASGSGGAEAEGLFVSDLQITDLTIHQVDGQGATSTLVLSEASVQTEGQDTPVAISARANLDGQAVTMDATVESFAALLDQSGPIAATVALGLDPVSVGYDGSVTLGEAPGVDGTLSLGIPADVTGGLGALDLSGRLVGDPVLLELASLTGTLGDATVSGDLWARAGDAPPAMGGSLSIDRLIMPPGAETTTDGPMIPDAALPDLSTLGVDLDLGITVGALVLADTHVTDLAMEVRIADGDASLGVASATLGTPADGDTPSGTTARGHASRSTDGQSSLRVSVDGANLSSVVSGLDGPGTLTLDFAGTGATVRELVGDGTGVFELTVGESVLVIGDSGIGPTAGAILGGILPLGDRGRIALNCVVARFDIAGGQMNGTGLAVDSPLGTITGLGSIDLLGETIAMVLRPRLLDTGIGVPVRVSGALADPSIAPDLGAGLADGLTVPLINPDDGVAGCVAAADAVPNLGVDLLVPGDLQDTVDGVLGGDGGLGGALDDALGGALPGGDGGGAPALPVPGGEGLGGALDSLIGN